MTCEQSVVGGDRRGSIIADETVDTKTFKLNAKHSCVPVISCL